jgi:hypothetical protein
MLEEVGKSQVTTNKGNNNKGNNSNSNENTKLSVCPSCRECKRFLELCDQHSTYAVTLRSLALCSTQNYGDSFSISFPRSLRGIDTRYSKSVFRYG